MNTKQKIYLASGLCLIIAIFLIGNIVKPLILEIKTTSVLVKDRNEKLIILQKTDQEYLKQLEQNYNDIQKDISLIKSGFLTVNDVVDFFIALENMAANTSNDLEIEAKDFPVFNIYLLGSFSNTMRFLGWLESDKYFLGINSLKIRRFSERDLSPEQQGFISAGDVKTTLEIRNYIKEDKIYEDSKNLESN